MATSLGVGPDKDREWAVSPVLLRIARPVLVLLALLYSPNVFAQPEPPGYRVAIDEAIAEFAAYRFGEARELFVRAHAIFPNARTLRGLGLAEFELRDYVHCIQHLDAALSSKTRPLDGELRGETEALRQRAAGFVARVTLVSRPQAARLLVDGAQAEWPVRPLLVPFGTHTLELFAPGYEPAKLSLSLSGGEERTLNVELRRPPGDHVRDTTDSGARWYQNPWLWTAVGIVVIAGGTAAGFAIANSLRADPPRAGTSGVLIQGI